MILITGHKGFIGRHLTSRLKESISDYPKSVETAYFNPKLLHTFKIQIRPVFAYPPKYIGYDLVDGQDIRDKYQLAKVFETNKIDTIIHLAAEAGVRRSEKYPKRYIDTNITGTRNLLELAEEYGVKHFILFSSSSVYGEQKSPLHEKMVMIPKSLYGITKAACEYMAFASPVPTTIVRPFSVYGENGRGDQVLYKWIAQIKAGEPITKYGDGTSERGYVYVGDLINGIMKLINRIPCETDIFNLGGQEVIKLNDLIKIFKKVYPKLKIKKMKMPKADVHGNWADISRAEKLLNWHPQTDFKQKVEEIIRAEL